MSTIHAKGRNGYIQVNSTSTPLLFIPSGSISNTATVLLSAATATVVDIGGTPVNPVKTGTITSVSTQTPFTSTLNSFYIPGYSGSGNYYTLTSNSLSLGTGDFTLECFVYMINIAGSTYSIIADFSPVGGVGGRTNGSLFYIGSSGQISIFQAGLFHITTANSTITTNTWYHIALVRLNGVVKIYVDGVEKGSTNNMSTANINLGACLIGRLCDVTPGSANAFNGYISNWRLVRGQAYYNGNFSKPTADLAVPTSARTWTTNYGIWTI